MSQETLSLFRLLMICSCVTPAIWLLFCRLTLVFTNWFPLWIFLYTQLSQLLHHIGHLICVILTKNVAFPNLLFLLNFLYWFTIIDCFAKVFTHFLLLVLMLIKKLVFNVVKAVIFIIVLIFVHRLFVIFIFVFGFFLINLIRWFFLRVLCFLFLSMFCFNFLHVLVENWLNAVLWYFLPFLLKWFQSYIWMLL